MSLANRLQQHIQDAQLMRPGDMVVVGVSGGPDSIALLHLLHGMRHDLGIQLHVAHYNHRWRDSADDDAAFVQKEARRLDLPCTLGRARGRASKTDKGSLEEKAREARLAFLKRTVEKNGADKAALAHTRDDLAETVLMRIIRGTGLQGFLAIQPTMETGAGLTVVRPLLEVTKQELLAYLKARRIAFRVDPTNRDPDFLRNRVRHKLLPLLRKDYNPQIEDALIGLSQTAARDFDFMREQTLECFGRICTVDSAKGRISVDINGFLAESSSLRRMVLRHVYLRLRGNTRQLTRAHVRDIERALEAGGKAPAVTWPGGIVIRRGRGHLTFTKPDSA